MESEKAKAGIERFRQEFIWVYGSETVAELCRLFGELAEIVEHEAEERLTRWNDPKEVPELHHNVLVKCEYIADGIYFYDIGNYNGIAWHVGKQCFGRMRIIGWREIH